LVLSQKLSKMPASFSLPPRKAWLPEKAAS
jgi:hypothetical protein